MSAAIDNVSNLFDRFTSGPLAHAVNTLSMGTVDNREELLLYRNAQGRYVPNSAAEREYRTNQALGNAMATAAGGFATVGFLFGRARVASPAARVAFTAASAMAGYTMLTPALAMVSNGLGATDKLAELGIPLVSNFADNFGPKYVEEADFYADEEIVTTPVEDGPAGS